MTGRPIGLDKRAKRTGQIGDHNTEETINAKDAESCKNSQMSGMTLMLFAANIRAAEIIQLGLFVPLSGSGANWGKGSEWMCAKGAPEVNAKGGPER